MGNYTVIADTSRTIIELLRNNLTPEPIPKMELIGLCPPNETGNYVLGLYLYNIEENKNMGTLSKTNIRPGLRQDPPTPLTLYYLLAVYSKADIATRVIDEQRIMGKAIQVLKDNTGLSQDSLYGTLRENNETLEITALNLSLDEKIKIWSLFNQPYRLSMFYAVKPVYLDSGKIEKTQRVVDVSFKLEER